MVSSLSPSTKSTSKLSLPGHLHSSKVQEKGRGGQETKKKGSDNIPRRCKNLIKRNKQKQLQNISLEGCFGQRNALPLPFFPFCLLSLFHSCLSHRQQRSMYNNIYTHASHQRKHATLPPSHSLSLTRTSAPFFPFHALPLSPVPYLTDQPLFL